MKSKIFWVFIACWLFMNGSIGRAVESMTVSPAAATVDPKVVAIDTNKDGKPDRWEYHEGSKVRVEADTNFDGKIDEIAHFENGKLVKGEKDSDYDGKMDKWIDY